MREYARYSDTWKLLWLLVILLLYVINFFKTVNRGKWYCRLKKYCGIHLQKVNVFKDYFNISCKNKRGAFKW